MKYLSVAFAAFAGAGIAQAATLTTSPITGASYPATLPRAQDTTDGRWYVTASAGTVAEIRNSNAFGSDSIGADAFYFRGAGNGGYVDAYFKFGGNLTVGDSVSFDVLSSWGDGTRGIEFLGMSAKTEYTIGGGLNYLGASSSGSLYGDTYNRAFSFELKALAGNQYTIRVSNKTPSGSNPAWEDIKTVSSTSGLGEIKFFTGGLPSTFDAGGSQITGIDNTGFFVNNFAIVPEPSTPLLLGFGLASLVALRQTRKA